MAAAYWTASRPQTVSEQAIAAVGVMRPELAARLQEVPSKSPAAEGSGSRVWSLI